MIFRNDLDAANARIESLEREKRELAEQNERMTARLHAQGTQATEPTEAVCRGSRKLCEDERHEANTLRALIAGIVASVLYILILIARDS